MNEHKIPFNFTYYAMKLLGKNLYSNPWTAVSEIVANGIDAGAKNVYVLIDMREKENAVVEIFDDGSGMSLEDLKGKYTLIGRNKRLEKCNQNGKTLGRKGIGKLAALYLSPKYYIYTKKDNIESVWMVDTNEIHDSDIPALIKVEDDKVRLISTQAWKQLKTGTMIHLSNVDLRKIGPERLKSLPVILADYYLENVIDATISVCVINNEQDPIIFKKIEKNINFDTLYGIFDNTGLGYEDRLKESVYLTKETDYPEVDFPRPTVKLQKDKYEYAGEITLTNLNGKTQKVPYKMIGWIGIHASLNKDILERNSKQATKIQNHPNALRLYVRGKLAVDNLMNYIRSTAAFASYIEGEISFDILDNDDFEDTSTSNREGYSLSDPRIEKLLNIVRKIITTLAFERNKIGNIINEEIKAIRKKQEELLVEEQRKREKAEAEALAEKQRAQSEECQRKDAENERDKIIEKNRIVEKRLLILENNFKDDGESYKHGMHLAVNFCKEIRTDVVDARMKISDKKEIISTLMNIDRNAEKIERLPDYLANVNFPLTSPLVSIDVIEFIHQYLLEKGSSRLNYFFDISTEYNREIDFAEIVLLIENIVTNSIKAKATSLKVKGYLNGDMTIIDFVDDGKGLNDKYRNNPDMIFELGETTTTGFGIGAYHIKEIVKKIGGEVFAVQNLDKGLTIRVSLDNE